MLVGMASSGPKILTWLGRRVSLGDEMPSNGRQGVGVSGSSSNKGTI